MIIRRFVLVIEQRWKLLAIFVLAACAISLFLSYSAVPLYRAQATFIIYPNASLTSSRDIVSSMDTLEKRTIITTYADILRSEKVYRDALQTAGLAGADVSLYQQNTLVQQESNILGLTVEGPDPAVAALLANSIGENGISLISSIYQVYDIVFLDQATLPAEPFSPQISRDLGFAATIGLLSGLLVIFVGAQLATPLGALRERMITDSLSGAFSRRHFVRLVQRELERTPTPVISLGMLKLEGLQDFYDFLPEPLLAKLLTRVTEILRNQLRGNDLVGKWDVTTFSVLLPTTPSTPAFRTMERLRQALLEPIEIGSSGEFVSLFPIAGVTTNGGGEDTDTMIDEAEAALNSAQQAVNKTYHYQSSSAEAGNE